MSLEVTHTRVFRGPRPAHDGTAAFVATPSGASLVTRGGFRDETLIVFTLGADGFDQGTDLDLPVPYYGAFGYHDGRALWVGVRDANGSLSLLRDDGARRTLAARLPDARIVATYDPSRGPIFAIGGVLYGVEEESLVPLADVGGNVTSLVHALDRVVLLDSRGEISALVGTGLVKLPSLPGNRTGTLAWDERRSAVVTLVGQGETTPVWLENGAWVHGEPIAARLKYAAMLAFHRGLGEVVVFGGADEGHSMRPERNDVFVLGGRTLTSPRSRRAGRRDVVKRLGEDIVVVSASDLSVDKLTQDGFSPYARCAWDAGPRVGLDDRYVRIAATNEAVWLVRGDGSTFRTDQGGFAELRFDVPSAVAARAGGELFWDAPRERLLLLGGYERNDAWSLDTSGWHRAPHVPWDDEVFLTETPRGLYAVSGEGEVWQMLDTGWGKAQSLALPRHTYVHAVVFEPRRDALLVLTSKRIGRTEFGLWVAAGSQLRALGVLPQSLEPALIDGRCFIVDTVTDRLLFLHGNVIDAVELGALGPETIGLPAASPFERSPRPAITRPAAQLVPTTRTHPLDGVPISDDYLFLAWIPASELLPLGGHASIAVGMRDDLFAHDTSDPFAEGFAVVLLDHAPDAPVVLHANAAVVADLVTFDDPDPTKLSEMDTTSDWDRATETKIGGYARPVQVSGEDTIAAQTSSPCRTCATPMRFVLQLSADLFQIGDAGRALVYVCPNGCDAGATADCH